jgi:hypothetical protein
MFEHLQATDYVKLTNLKNVIHFQLPNMPLTYICRIIFDRKHKSIVSDKKAGLVYKEWPHILEIVFVVSIDRGMGKGLL